MEQKSQPTAAVPETCILVGVITSDQTEEMTKEYNDELAFLAETAGVITKKKFLQRIDRPNPKTYIGSGKMEGRYSCSISSYFGYLSFKAPSLPISLPPPRY
jgi:GTP-binding protein HflX